MEIRFLYSEDCPSHEEALVRLRQVMREEHINASLEIIEVKAEAEAEKLKFVGSPTILVDGQDIDPLSQPHYAVTCRAYRLEEGRISPLPSIAMIRRALRSAAGKQA